LNPFYFFVLGTNHFINKGVGYRKTKKMVGGVDLIYISRTEKKTGVGVRRDDIIHMILPEFKNALTFSSPCVCGSVTHFSPRDHRCLLSVQYMDVN